MIHLALPDLPPSHNWLSEGIAVYVESIARVQAGHLTDEVIWSTFVRDMPQGLPQEGDLGLDHTPTWGRTYWGGALFCLLADVEIRKRTANRLGLQDALKAVLAAGGNHEVSWPVRRILRVGDKATGVIVLTGLYEKMRAAPVSPGLGALWRDLGLETAGLRISFDESAPLAAVRRAITAAPAPSTAPGG